MFFKQWMNHAPGTWLPSCLPSQWRILTNFRSLRRIDALKGWKWVDGYKSFEYGVSDDVHYQGHKCLVTRYVGPPANPPFPYPLPAYRATARLTQNFNAVQYRSKRMKFSAVIKSEGRQGSVALGMIVSGLCQDQMDGRNISGIAEWKRAEIVLDVPESTGIQFGFIVQGKAEIWVSNVVFEESTNETTGIKLYEDEPQNLDFSE